MDTAHFEAKKAALDEALDRAPDNVGMGFGYELFREFKVRGLLQSKAADFVLFNWSLPSYRERFVYVIDIADDDYRIGTRNA
jgi:hypothetical protein